MIEACGLTLEYSNGKGIFNLDFSVEAGRVMGYLGPNGAGKTTTIRNLLGFTKPSGGSCSINGMSCFENAAKIQKTLGYVPGEIAFPDGMTGEGFLKFMAQMRGTTDLARQNELCEMFELDLRGSVKRFSKGMKQKLGIVAAFMHDPDVLILDEPTSGLDPLMQNVFVELVLAEKRRGKTILMSSHSFEEIERTSDDVLIIKDGKIVEKSDIDTLKSAQSKIFSVKSDNSAELFEAAAKEFATAQAGDKTIEITVKTTQINAFLRLLANYEITDFSVKAQTLEEAFLHFYEEGEHK